MPQLFTHFNITVGYYFGCDVNKEISTTCTVQHRHNDSTEIKKVQQKDQRNVFKNSNYLGNITTTTKKVL